MSRLRRTRSVVFLGVLGSVVVYTLMMAFGDPGLELSLCAVWVPLYLIAYAVGLPEGPPSPRRP
jgi:hypothetical protein